MSNDPLNHWPESAPDGVLSAGGVGVWLMRLDGPSIDLASLRAVLSDEERDRADRLRFPADRDRLVAAHGLLRKLLSVYTECPPADIAFRAAAGGKPHLDPARHGSHIRFSLSHSADLAMCAVARDVELGVDLEQISPDVDMARIARQFFAPAEAEAIEEATPADRSRIFYTIWVCKEACLKAIGRGLSLPLSMFEIRCAGPTPSVHLANLDDALTVPQLHLLPDIPGFVAALAIAGAAEPITCRRWTDHP